MGLLTHDCEWEEKETYRTFEPKTATDGKVVGDLIVRTQEECVHCGIAPLTRNHKDVEKNVTVPIDEFDDLDPSELP